MNNPYDYMFDIYSDYELELDYEVDRDYSD